MAFTGVLGDGELGEFLLGSGGEGDATTQTVQARANILNTSTQTVQARANILNTSTQTVQAKARIVVGQVVQARARIAAFQSVQAKARIFGIVTSGTLQVEFDVLEVLQQRLMVQFDVGDKVRSAHTVQARARILLPITARLSVQYNVNYPMPTTCVVRPTQRTFTRSVRTCSARARIVRD